jgi:hypothetical protein
MAKRLFESNDAWEDIASRCNNEVEALFAVVLVRLEVELGEPVDLRDFHYVGASALGSFISDLSIRRRLGAGDEPPRDKAHYPRLTTKAWPGDAAKVKEEPESWLHKGYDGPLVEGSWRCGVMLDGSNCIYEGCEDPMHDECINCGEPEERK